MYMYINKQGFPFIQTKNYPLNNITIIPFNNLDCNNLQNTEYISNKAFIEVKTLYLPFEIYYKIKRNIFSIYSVNF